MKSYKKYPKQFIGSSDDCFLYATTNQKNMKIFFEQDGDYFAYIVDKDANIGQDFRYIGKSYEKLEIKDEFGNNFAFEAKVIKMYINDKNKLIIQLM